MFNRTGANRFERLIRTIDFSLYQKIKVKHQ